MNPVIEELLIMVERDPVPAAHTSSFWKHYGRETTVERSGDELVLRGSGFGNMYAPRPLGKATHLLQRITYSRVTSRLHSYKSVWKTAIRLAHDLQFDLTFDVWRQSVALAVLADHWAAHNLSPRTFAMIGDGYGFLGALVRRRLPESRIYCIDLPKTLVFQAQTHEQADRTAKMSIVPKDWGVADVNFVLPQHIEFISDDIDCAVNIASMMEMKDSSIAAYFTFLRHRSTPQSRFYCVNRLRKELPGGEVTSFKDYPWRGDDEVFVDGPCPYYTHFLGPHTLSKGPKVLGVRVPFINHFDGMIMHRLAHLAPI